jgi:polysaccharide deacetylase family protein (PEP-CTERM system associated)
LHDSISLLEDIIGKKVIGHRAASFSIVQNSLWALDCLVAEGIKYDCSVFPILHPRYGIINAERFPHQISPGLTEFPPSTVRILGNNFPIAGGIYFRALPYFLIKKAIKRINKQGKPVQIYIHPWEIDPNQPRLRLPLDRSIPHYANIRCVAAKLKNLLEDFEFAPVKKVLDIE